MELDIDDVLKAAQQVAQQPVRPDSSGEYLVSEALAAELLGRLRFADHRGRWMAYGGGIWRPVTDSEAAETSVQAAETFFLREIAATTSNDKKRFLSRHLEAIYRTSTIRGALFFLAGKDGFATNQADWDSHPWLLPCNNGVLNLKTGALLPHSPDYLFTRKINASYDPNAECPNWDAHIEKFLPNPEVRRHVKRSLGMALVGKALDEKLEIWHGHNGNNGKSTTIETLLNVFGEFSTMAAPDLLVQSKYEPHPTRLADLDGRRLVFSVEVEKGKRLNESLVKYLTGDGRQKARFMRQDYFEMKQTFDVFLVANDKPAIVGQDNAIWRRIRVVPWEIVIPPKERLPRDEVVARFTSEADGILNWLLAGLKDWQSDHWWVAPDVSMATEAYRSEQDRISGFLADCCELGPYHTVDKGQLYAEYAQWCLDNGEDAVSKRTFSDLLKGRGITEARNMKARKWVGLRIIT